jgi:hypothetical protein
MGVYYVEALLFHEAAQSSNVLYISKNMYVLTQMKMGDRLHATLEGNSLYRLLYARRGRRAGKSHIMSVLPELQGKIEGMLGRPGPFPVAEDMQNFHPGPSQVKITP